MMDVKGVLFTVLNRLIEFTGIDKVNGIFFFYKIILSLGNLLWNCYPFSCTSLVGILQI